MNLDFPLVTIITPSYNRASFLKETIESVLSQDYPNIEYIVLDDGSTDKTRELLATYAGRLIWEAHPNMGEQRTVNKGYQMAKGELIAIVNSDDPIKEGAVKAAVSLLMENPEALAVYPDYDVIDANSNTIKTETLPVYNIYNALLEFNIAMGPGMFIRRKALELLGGRDLKYRYAGDVDFLLRLMMNGKFIHIPRVLATHRVHADAASLTGRGGRLANELIWTIDKVFADPRLPADLRNQRLRIYANVHHEVSFWCGRNLYEKTKHRIISANYAIRNKNEVYNQVPVGQRLSKIFTALGRRVGRWAFGLISILSLWVRNLINLPKLLLITFGNAWIKIFFLVIRTVFSFTISLRKLSSGNRFAKRQKAFALVSSYLPPKWSGGAVIIGRLLRGLDPDLYCLISHYSDKSAAGDYIESLPADYHEVPDIKWFPAPNVSSFLGKSKDYYRMHFAAIYRSWFIASILKAEGCSVVIGTTGDFVGVLAVFYAARLAKVQLYLYYFDDYVSQWWADSTWVNLAYRLETFIVPSVKGFIVPNEYMRDELIERHRISFSNIHIVHNPCAASDIPDNMIAPVSHADEIKILFTGAIYHVNYDAFRSLIKAIQNLGDSRVKLHLYTAQSVELLKNEGIDGASVVFHSHVPPPEAADAQEQADILLLPFTFNPNALALVRTSATAKLADYLMTGRPILAIVPPDTYVDWYLKEYECGIVANSDNPVEIANAILQIVQDKALRQRLGTNARARARIDFNPLEAQKDLLRAIGF